MMLVRRIPLTFEKRPL